MPDGIRSERRLCEEVHLNLAYRWFCRLDLADRVPNHSTFSKNRHGRFRDSDLLRHLFETVVARCIAEGLASGQRLAADASIIQADANRQNSTPKSDWQPGSIDPEEAPRAVREYLETLADAAFGAASPVEPKFAALLGLLPGEVAADHAAEIVEARDPRPRRAARRSSRTSDARGWRTPSPRAPRASR